MKVLFIFLDGIGLGENNPETNPFARAKMPNLNALLDGQIAVEGLCPVYRRTRNVDRRGSKRGRGRLAAIGDGSGNVVDREKYFSRTRLSLRTQAESRSRRIFERGNVIFALCEGREKNRLAQCLPTALLRWDRFRQAVVFIHSTGSDQRRAWTYSNTKTFLPGAPSRRISPAMAGGPCLASPSRL